jgi:hypothetical protein
MFLSYYGFRERKNMTSKTYTSAADAITNGVSDPEPIYVFGTQWETIESLEMYWKDCVVYAERNAAKVKFQGKSYPVSKRRAGCGVFNTKAIFAATR